MRPCPALLRIALAAASLLGWAGASRAAPPPQALPWLRSDTQAFAAARSEHKFVILYLEAVWCHWCHVMDEKTYADPAIRAEIAAHFVPLRIDQDLRPDLSNRYKDYGWPATVVFAADGTEIVKRQGFVEPARFLRLLRAIEADPSPEKDDDAAAAPVAEGDGSGPLDAATRATLRERHAKTYDAQLGGLAIEQKFIEPDSIEYALSRADAERAERDMALHTLDAAHALIDPVWGGVYQYSTYSDWQHPHFEKLATIQADALRVYALAQARFGRAADAAAVADIRRYLAAFLTSPDGAFYTSQDADLHPGEHADGYFALDDAARRAQGMPRVDRHVYSLQNGLLIEQLARIAEWQHDATALTQARRAARWIIAHRALPGGGLRHDEQDAAGPYLGDTLAMGRAFLALYRADADRDWLRRAQAAAAFIQAHFAGAQGYVTAVSHGPIATTPLTAENIALARFANALARETGAAADSHLADAALRGVTRPAVALASITEAGVLLAADEAASDPVHLTVIGAKDDAGALALFSAAQALPFAYKRLDWWDLREGALPNPDVSYPPQKRAAAFVCTANRCSLPIFDPSRVAAFVASAAPRPRDPPQTNPTPR